MRQNILLITSDQQHWSLLGSLTPAVRTPNLDRLAAQGTRFDRAYCPNPTCTPTRASMITGQYPSQHGAWALGTKLMEDHPTIGDELRAAGYRSALIGKGHFSPLRGTDEFPSLESYPKLQDLDFWRRFEGPFYGFDDFELVRNHVDEGHVGQHYALWLESKGFTGWRSCFRPPGGVARKQVFSWNLPEEYHYNTFVTERSIARMRDYQGAGQPFVLWASYPDPHPPYLVPEPWASMYDPATIELPPLPLAEELARAVPLVQLTQQHDPDFSMWRESGQGCHGLHSHVTSTDPYHPGTAHPDLMRKAIAVYYGMVSMLDHHVGQLLDFLDASGLAEETLVVFTSDHGHYFGQHGLVAKGAFHYEDGIRVPFISRTPGQSRPGTVSSALVSLVDLAPTFLAFLGLPVPGRMAGINQLPVLRGQTPALRDHLIVENRHEMTTVYLQTLVTQSHKLTVYFNQPYGELYDLENDPDERLNLWDDPAAAALKARLLLKFAHAEMAKVPPFMPRTSGA